MSQWTHVAGIIRIDSVLEFVNQNTKIVLRDIITGMSLPAGSEGPVKIQTLERPDFYKTARISWGSVIITGDLRDYDDVQELKEWWISLIEKLSTVVDVRDGVMSIRVEGQECVVVLASKK